ncbi:unnamed protein product [Linum trigynum]|uniref:Uncharacterized protein n=1 Tax=Linum trigynum TaxID=586398 RepID=A0AAV2DHP5_9ROSI
MAMENAADCQITGREPLLATKSSSSNGGFRALPFIIVTDALEKMVSYGLPVNMIMYLTTEYGMKNSDGAHLIFIWVATTNFTPVVAAVLADSYVGRYWMIAFGSLAHALGTFLLWLTATIPQARPQPCVDTTCKQATLPQLSLLCTSLALISIGSGSMRSSSLAFCADQIIPKNKDGTTNDDSGTLLKSLVSWYFISSTVAILIAVTVIVYIQEAAGWRVGFGVPLILIVSSGLIFISGSSLYLEQKTKPSLLAELAQVVVAAAGSRKRWNKLPSEVHTYHSNPNSAAIPLHPSDKLMFLNKACIIDSPEEELNPDGTATNPWTLCTVEQVEDLKSVIRVIPIWFAGVIMSLPTTQLPFYLLQLNTMDRHIINPTGFQIPAGSFFLTIVLTQLIWVPLYNKIITPITSKLIGKPFHLSMKQRLGLGILISSAAISALAIVEMIRRERAIEEGLTDDPTGIVDMSAMWFVVYYVPFGVAEAFNYLAQSEFYYSELPESMASISTTLYQMGLSMASLVASFVLSGVEILTRGGREWESWIAGNINKGHYDYYYWLIAGLIVLDFVYYLGCAKAYGPCKAELGQAIEDAGRSTKHHQPDKMSAVKEPLLLPSHGGDGDNLKGGFRTLPFIIGAEAFEKVATLGLMPNMILYLTTEYGMGNVQGANLLFLWSAATNFTPVLGAFLADSYVGRFRMIAFGSIFSLMGLVTIWLTAMIPQARPGPCTAVDGAAHSSTTCEKTATTPQLILLYSSFILMSIGSGGVRSSAMAFGADQLTPLTSKNNNNNKILESFFSWWYMLVSVSVILALTCIVCIQETMGWKVGFGVPVVLMSFAAVSFFLASPFYVTSSPADSSLFTGLAQVLVASFTKRSVSFPDDDDDVDGFHHPVGTTRLLPSENVKFLNRACRIQNPDQDLTAEGAASNPWRLCTVDQVEDLKSLLRIVPIWSTGMIMAIDISQGSFQTIMASNMDRHVTPSIEIPAGSFSVFMVAALAMWVVVYDKVLIPVGSRIRGKPARLTTKERMGAGIFLSSLSMAALGAAETFRRQRQSVSGTQSSAMWMMPSLVLLGLAEGLNGTAQSEFYYKELPRSMSSVSTTLWGVAMSGASLASSFIMNAVDGVTAADGGESWVSSDIDKGRYDYYYWLLAVLSLANFVYYLGCSGAYGPAAQGMGKQADVVVGYDDVDFKGGA